MKTYSLGELITQRREKNPNSDLPIWGVSKDGWIPPKQIEADTSIYNVFYRGDFVFNPARMELNSIAFNDICDKGICSSLYEVFYVHKKDVLLPEYLSLIVKQEWFRRYCEFLGSGSAREYCRFANISEISIDIPEIEEQEKIVKYYDVIRKRIEIKKKINDNLFQSIQNLRKSWLEEYIPFGGKRPSNWVETSFSDIASFTTGYSYSSNELIDSDLAMLTIKNFERNGGFKVDGYKEISPVKTVKNEQYATLFDVVVAHTDLTQGNIIGNAECVLCTADYNKIILSMDLVKVTPKTNEISTFLIAALLQDQKFKNHCVQYTNGTTVMHLSKKALPEYKLFMPSNKYELYTLNKQLEQIYHSISNNMIDILQLQKLQTIVLSLLSR